MATLMLVAIVAVLVENTAGLKIPNEKENRENSLLPSLVWEDCGLATDVPLIKLLDYQHAPDPIVYAANSTIYKRWEILRSLPAANKSGDSKSKHGYDELSVVHNLTEHVTVARQNTTGHWEVQFLHYFLIPELNRTELTAQCCTFS